LFGGNPTWEDQRQGVSYLLSPQNAIIDTIFAQDNPINSIASNTIASFDPNTPLTGLWNLATGNQSFADSAKDFATFNAGLAFGIPGLCFAKGTKMKLANGKEKRVEKIKLGDTMMKGGLVTGYGVHLASDLYDYNGIKVTGTHAVLEDGKWTRVSDSRVGKKLDESLVEVYLIDNLKHRIVINDVTFADFSECDNSVNMTADQRLEFLNANLTVPN
jgi:hypothetical protein